MQYITGPHRAHGKMAPEHRQQCRNHLTNKVLQSDLTAPLINTGLAAHARWPMRSYNVATFNGSKKKPITQEDT